LSEKAAGPDKQELDEKITDVSKRWEGIMGKVTKRLAILEEVVVCSVQYAEASEQVKLSLDSMEEKVKIIKDVSSEPEVMNKQDDTAKVRFTLPVLKLDL
jgi:hypothetical protein